ncbi:MAG TPA: ABC transporter transmembrane domain-containing protein, partial [Terriglobales bacterium]|nr:ABC transporter transmembrane domain-containing protein [Terriglobales bacterium]
MSSTRHPELRLFRRLLSEARPYWPHIAGIFLLSLLESPLGLLGPVPLKIALDNVIDSHPLPRFLDRLLPASLASSPTAILAVAVFLLLGITALENLLGLADSFFRTYTSEKLLLNFRSRLFSHMQGLSFGYHDTKTTADSVYRIQYDTAAMQYLAIDGIPPFVTSAVTLAMMFYVTFRIDRQLALIATFISPVLLVLSRAYRPRFRERSKEVKELESSAMGVLHEVLSALRVVKAFGREEHEENRYVRQSSASMSARIRLGLLGGYYSLLVSLTTALGTASVLWIGVQHVRAGLLTPGNLFLVISYLGQLYSPLKTIGTKAASLQGYLVGLERVFSVLDLLPAVPEKPNAQPLARTSGSVEFRNVSFEYGVGHPVLRGISFQIRAGARVGVFGRTG